mgnify:CR=1 FL=1
MTKERNFLLESDGLYWESETHEWFYDKGSTFYAHKHEDLKTIFCFITRNKETGDYDHVIMNSKNNQIVYDSKSVEAIGAFIDMMAMSKKFNSKK